MPGSVAESDKRHLAIRGVDPTLLGLGRSIRSGDVASDSEVFRLAIFVGFNAQALEVTLIREALIHSGFQQADLLLQLLKGGRHGVSGFHLLFRAEVLLLGRGNFLDSGGRRLAVRHVTDRPLDRDKERTDEWVHKKTPT